MAISFRAAAVAAALAILPLAAPAAVASTPVFGKNAELVNQLPEAAGAVAIEFSTDSPLMVVSTLKGIHTYDISDPVVPKRLGFLPMVVEQNEDMSMVERGGDEKYVLIGSNLLTAGLQGLSPVATTSRRRVLIVDVSRPASPTLISHVDTPTRTHTVSCATRTCEYAYTDGRTQGSISIVDLRDMHNPKPAGTFASVVPQGHDQDADEAGILWHVGGQGSVALDVSDPTQPVQLNGTNNEGVGRSGAGEYQSNPYNNFIHHNSFRPNADAFEDEVVDADGDVTLDSGEPSLANGNVLLVTEEDYVNTRPEGAGRCGDYEGSFQTWHIPWLDAGAFATRLGGKEGADRYGQGTIAPLDRWNTELLESGQPTPAGAFCSAHYFDYRNGFVAQGWYQQGTRILDVRDPKDIKQVGYFFTGTSETWGAYFVSRKWAGKHETIVYTADAVRGIDVLRVALPKRGPKSTRVVRAPVLRKWIRAAPGLTKRRSAEWGFVCPLPPVARRR